MISRFIKMMAKKKKNEKGFTLVELMVVVAIIGVLTAIAVPVYNNSQKKARFNAHLANVRILLGAAVQATALGGNPSTKVEWNAGKNKDETEEGKYDKNIKTEHLWGQYLQEWPTNPYKSEDYYSVEIATDGQITIYVGGDRDKVVTPNQTEEDYKNLKQPTQN